MSQSRFWGFWSFATKRRDQSTTTKQSFCASSRMRQIGLKSRSSSEKCSEKLGKRKNLAKIFPAGKKNMRKCRWSNKLQPKRSRSQLNNLSRCFQTKNSNSNLTIKCSTLKSLRTGLDQHIRWISSPRRFERGKSGFENWNKFHWYFFLLIFYNNFIP